MEKNYSEELARLIKDIKQEISDDVKDGILSNMSFGSELDEGELYSYFKNEGYDITYNEFLEFLKDCKENVDKAKQNQANLDDENEITELCEDDLEAVAGGSSIFGRVADWAESTFGSVVMSLAGDDITIDPSKFQNTGWTN